VQNRPRRVSNPCTRAVHADACTDTNASCRSRSNAGSYRSGNTGTDARTYASRLSDSHASSHSEPRTSPAVTPIP